MGILGAVARTTARNLLCGALCVGGYLGVQAAIGDTMTYVPADVPAATVSPAGLPGGCWTDNAPADMRGQIPGHVALDVDGQIRIRGERAVGKALEQIFDGTNHGLTVVAFCR